MAGSNITKNALAQAMKELMLEKKFEKISVTDICNQCGMNRKSFYYHFRDKYDLVNWIFYVGFMDHVSLGDYQVDEGENNPDRPWKLLTAVLDYFYEDRAFYKKALMIEGQNSFRDYFHDAVIPVFQYFLFDVLDGEDYADMFVMMICDAFIDALVRWLQSDEPERPEELISGIKEMSIRLANKIVQENK